MKNDISGRQDIKALVDRFYRNVLENEELAPLFAHVVWARHLPVMYDFWENALFYTGGYAGNPLEAHMNFHKKSPLTESNFDTWIRIFNDSVDELFEGKQAELTKQRAASIAAVMKVKILSTKNIIEN